MCQIFNDLGIKWIGGNSATTEDISIGPSIALTLDLGSLASKISLFSLLIYLSFACAALSQTKEVVEQVALEFSAAYNSGDSSKVHGFLTGEFGRNKRVAVLNDEIAIALAKSGGPASTVSVVGSTPFTYRGNGTQGNLYFVRLDENHPLERVFFDIYLIKEGPVWSIEWYDRWFVLKQ